MSKKYTKFRYLYPPRPEQTIPFDAIDEYDNGEYIGQAKLNGDCAEFYFDGEKVRYFNRHKKEGIKLFKLEDSEVLKLHKSESFMVLSGEYMNKNKKGIDGKPWNHKFVIWDILVYNGEHLIGTTYEERVKLLDELYGVNEYNDYLYEVSENIFRVKTFYKNFSKIWNQIVEIDMLEGFVFKRKSGKLTDGTRNEKNGQLNSIKCRKSTKNYKF